MSHVTPVVSECTEDDAGVILAQGLAKNQGVNQLVGDTEKVG